MENNPDVNQDGAEYALTPMIHQETAGIDILDFVGFGDMFGAAELVPMDNVETGMEEGVVMMEEGIGGGSSSVMEGEGQQQWEGAAGGEELEVLVQVTAGPPPLPLAAAPASSATSAAASSGRDGEAASESQLRASQFVATATWCTSFVAKNLLSIGENVPRRQSRTCVKTLPHCETAS